MLITTLLLAAMVQSSPAATVATTRVAFTKCLRDDLKKAFKAKHGYDLAPPKTWKQFDDIGSFFTEALKKDGIYGAAMFREAGYGNFMFQERFRNEGGKFFDANMKATINSPAGVKVLSDWVAENKWMPPGVEKFGFVENLAAFLSGQTAMTISWPPYGRWAAGYGSDQEALSWVPKSTIAGKVGYALPPGGHPQLAAGFSLSVSSASKNKEAAYLFIQWLNSEEVSTQRAKFGAAQNQIEWNWNAVVGAAGVEGQSVFPITEAP